MVRYSEFFENNSKLFPWQILSCPQSVYQNENLAVAALIWVAIKSNKPIRLVSKNDLKKYMLRTLFKYHDFANIKARATEKIKILEGEKRISANKIGGIVMF